MRPPGLAQIRNSVQTAATAVDVSVYLLVAIVELPAQLLEQFVPVGQLIPPVVLFLILISEPHLLVHTRGLTLTLSSSWIGFRKKMPRLEQFKAAVGRANVMVGRGVVQICQL